MQTFTDLFVQDKRQSQMGGFIAKLAAINELIGFAAIAVQVDSACLPA